MVLDVRFENWGISPDFLPSSIFDHATRLDQPRASETFDGKLWPRVRISVIASSFSFLS